MNQFSRSELLLDAEAMEKLSKARVAIFGIVELGDMWSKPWFAVVSAASI